MTFNVKNRRAISPVIATVIIVAVSIAIAIAVAFWISGIISATGYGTRPVKLAIYNDLDVKGAEVGSQFRFTVKNLGGDTVFIDMIVIDGKYQAIIISARNENGENRLSEDRSTIYIKPGETVEVYGIIRSVKLDPSTTHEIKLHTAQGYEFMKTIKVSYMAMSIGGGGGAGNPFARGAFSTGVKRSDGTIVCVFKDTIKNNLAVDFTNGKLKIYLFSEPSSDPIKTIDLGDEYNIPAGEEKEIIAYFTLDPSYANQPLIVTLEYTAGAGEEEFSYYMDPPKPIKLYIINIEDAPSHWVDASLVESKAKELLGEDNVVTITTMDQLSDLILNPPDYAIIINTHGEAVPIIDDYIDPSNNPLWEDYYDKIKDNIANKGWVWVSCVGYSFYYVVSDINRGWDLDGGKKFRVGPPGVKRFLPSASQWNTGDAYKVSEWMDELETIFDVSLPEPIYASRAVSGEDPEIKFYEITGGKHAAAAYRIGNGFLVINGWPPGGEETVAHTAVYFGVYTFLKGNIIP